MQDTTTKSTARDTRFYGDLSSKQLRRMIPGFFRVEVLPAGYDSTQTKLDPIPIDLNFGQREGTRSKITFETHVDPKLCCHIPGTGNKTRPLYRLPHNPESHQLVTWETGIKGLSVRELPSSSYLNWVAFLPGVKDLPNDEYVGSYWSGDSGLYGPNERRPAAGEPKLFGQQGGFMISRDQIVALEKDLCPGRFFPPFSEPHFKQDGLWNNNVEFYSGGYQLFSTNVMKSGCNLQRIVDLNPANFPKHLLYHTANNKQQAIDQERLVKIDHLLGQLNSVKKMATKAKDAQRSRSLE